MSIIEGLTNDEVQKAIRNIIYFSINNEERELMLTQMLRDFDKNNLFNKSGVWQTIDEFKDNPVEGWCYIYHNGKVKPSNYKFHYFAVTDSGMSAYVENLITHVMPIKTPEAPK